jgi:hypothetical protein
MVHFQCVHVYSFSVCSYDLYRVAYCSVSMSCVYIYGLSILSCCGCFWLLACVLFIWYGTLCPIVLYTRTFPLVDAAFVVFVCLWVLLLRFAFWMLFLVECPWTILWSFLFVSRCMWMWPISFSGVVDRYLYFVFVRFGVLWYLSHYICCYVMCLLWCSLFSLCFIGYWIRV